MQIFQCRNFRFSVKFLCEAEAGQNRAIYNKNGMAGRHSWNGLANEPELLKYQSGFQDQSETHLKYGFEKIPSDLITW